MDIEEICKNLQSEEKSTRMRALKTLLTFCENINDDDDGVLKTSEQIISVYDKCYLHLLKCYSDRYNCCRELSCTVITEFMKKLPKNDYYLQYIINAIALRIGQKELQEHDEDMRLIYLQQLTFLIEKYRCDTDNDNFLDTSTSKFKIENNENGGGDDINDDDIGSDDEDDIKNENSKRRKYDLLLKSYDDIINILLKTLTDSYPAVQKESCNCIQKLSLATPSFHYRAETLTKSLYPILYHKYSANRIEAVKALCCICLHINTNQECIQQIIMEITPIIMDPIPLVRKECGIVGCKWLMELKDRYSYFERILPLVLCCLNDDSVEVKEHIEKLWIKCGEKYYEENENELIKIDLIDKIPKYYPKEYIKKRPTLGCRALVQRNLKMIKSVMYETGDWKEQIRLHSLKLLWQIVLHSEHILISKFMDIYPDLCVSCSDTDKNVTNMAIQVAELMGNLLNHDDWFKLAIEYLEQKPKIGCLKCFYYLFYGSGNYNDNDILYVAKLLATKDFSNSLKPEVQYFTLRLVDVLIDRYHQNEIKSKTEESIENAMEKLHLNHYNEIEKYLYHVIIKVMSLSLDSKSELNITVYGENLLKKLTNQNDNDYQLKIMNLHKMYLNTVIETNLINVLDSELDEFTEPILLLYGIICVCGFHKNYLNSLKNCIRMVWDFATIDGKIKIFTAISIGILKWNETMLSDDIYEKNDKQNKSIDIDIENVKEENLILLREFIKDIVEEHLIWQPGANAESLRTFATATLCAITENVPEESKKILPDLISYFKNLIEDKSIKTRIYAIRCFMNFGQLKYEQFRPFAYELVACLDDSCAEVRYWTARILCKFDISLIENDDIEKECWKNFIRYTFELLITHFDTTDKKLKQYIKETLIELGKKYTNIFIEIIEKNNSECKDEIKEILLENIRSQTDQIEKMNTNE